MANSIGKEIRKIRKRTELTQARFGRRIGVTGQAISLYELGNAQPSLKLLEKISTVYGKEIEVLTKAKKKAISQKISSLEKEMEALRELLG